MCGANLIYFMNQVNPQVSAYNLKLKNSNTHFKGLKK